LKRFVNLVEKYLIRLIVLSLVALVVVQGLMTRDEFRLYLSLGEKLEGQKLELPVINNNESAANDNEKTPTTAPTVKSPQAIITISLEKFSSLPKAFILVNDRKMKDFSDKDIKLELSAGDTIEIDATSYNFPVSFKIKDVSSNVAFPQINQVFQANQGIVMLGKVIVK
jgi:hypothetical protein